MPNVELPALLVSSVAAVTSAERLVLLNRAPEPHESQLPIDSVIALEIVSLGPDGVDRSATAVWVDGVPAFDGSAVPEIWQGFDGAGTNVVQGADTLGLRLQPTAFFASQAIVEVRVVSATIGGAHTMDVSYSFSVEDRTAPRVVAGQATAPRSVRLELDEAVRLRDGGGFVVTALDRPAVSVTVVDAVAVGMLVVLTFDIEMTPDVRYQVVASGIVDLAGKPGPYPF